MDHQLRTIFYLPLAHCGRSLGMRHEYSHAPRQSWQAVTGLVGWTIVYVQTLSFMRWPRLVVADAP